MYEHACCFTGHRFIDPAVAPVLTTKLKEAISSLAQEGYTDFLAGGALGFDTLAALALLALRKDHPQLRLTIVVPCEGQTRGWPPEQVEIYQFILSQADARVYTAKTYFRGCMQKRNRYLVEHSATCICYLTKPTGGTAYTVQYAKGRGLSVLNLACPSVQNFS